MWSLNERQRDRERQRQIEMRQNKTDRYTQRWRTEEGEKES